jgi:hypothetical protein
MSSVIFPVSQTNAVSLALYTASVRVRFSRPLDGVQSVRLVRGSAAAFRAALASVGVQS